MSQFPRKTAHNFIKSVLAQNSLADAIATIRKEAKKHKIIKNGWRSNFEKLADGLESGCTGYSIFAKGNGKLPFWSFSELPQYTCPGAGDCLDFCYSFKAWQYPAALCRQLQNTLLMRFKRGIVAKAFQAIKPTKGQTRVTVRLYVDGDFADLSTFTFWMGQLHRADYVDAYGYSKSWEVIKEYASKGLAFPANYTLNLSSGSKYGETLKTELAGLSITRGEFVAVVTNRDHGKSAAKYDSKDYHSDVRESARAEYNTPKVFSCPGRCGDCLPNGQHACGLKGFGVLVAIGEH